MSSDANLCMEWMMIAVSATSLFDSKVFEVYDPAILQEIASKLNYPVCGLVYEGITSEGQGFDQGVSTMLSIGVLVLAESRSRDVTQNVDKGQITVMLDTLRSAISRKVSPTNNEWEFVLEVPMDLGDRGLVYYQKWRTGVVI